MDFRRLYTFLQDLQDNNHKEWMDAHRKEYTRLREDFISWLDKMGARLAAIDPDYYDTPGRKAINRINNNLMYSPDKPVYKDHFGAGLDQVSKSGDFYIQLGVNASFLASGYWKPDKRQLNSIREAIDYNGEELKVILDKSEFKRMFGGLIETEDMLKTSPKGYSKDHQHIDLLRHKSFVVEYPLQMETVLSDDFESLIEAVYIEMLPFRRYLNKAVSV